MANTLLSTISGALAATLLSVGALVPAAFAGGDAGCRADCRVIEPVTMRAAIVHQPAAVINRTHRVEVVPTTIAAERVPASYGYVSRVVTLRPATVRYERVAAHYKTVSETVVVQPAGWRTEMRRDRHGRETLCRVAVPAVTKQVTREVLIAPERIVAHTTPAVHGVRYDRVLHAPERWRHTVVPGRVAYVETPVVVREAQTRVVYRPAHEFHGARRH